MISAITMLIMFYMSAVYGVMYGEQRIAAILLAVITELIIEFAIVLLISFIVSSRKRGRK